jgi:putative heme iron utilization protein
MVAYAHKPDFSRFYLLTSDLALHTHDMRDNKDVSLLIAELDDGRVDVLTLARVELRGEAELIMRGEPGYTGARSLYLERFPRATPLFELGDFRLWQIKIKGGRFVAGFAKAFNITIQSLAKISTVFPNANEG